MSEPSPIFLSSPDPGGRGAGDAIKRAREAQGMTLESLASMIKVTPAKLEALEQGRYDLLPDANFTRALAMTVCRALKMDTSEVLAGLPAAKPAPLAEGKPPLNQPFKESKGGAPLFDRHALNWSALLTLKYLAPVLLLIGAVLIYVLPDSVETPGWLSVSRPSASSPRTSPSAQPVHIAPDAASAVASPSAPASSVATASLTLDAADPASAVPSAPPSAPVLPGAAGIAVTAPLQSTTTLSSTPAVAPMATPGAAPPASTGSLNVMLTAPAWIEVKDATGKRLIARLAQPGENLWLDGPAPLQVRLGNVAAVQMRFKGQPVDLSSFTRNNVARIELK